MVYMGSKAKITDYIVPVIQSHIAVSGSRTYIEPFCGGCNVIDKIKANNRIAADKNEYLIALFKHLQSGGKLPDAVPKEEYDRVRADKESFPAWYVGAVGFLASFNGRFFDGGYAGIGYDRGRKRDYFRENSSNILKQMQRGGIAGIDFMVKDYREFCPKGCVVYCDPPYDETKEYGIAKAFDRLEFWQIMRDWSRYNTVLISEQKAPEDFITVWEKDVDRTMKAKEHFKATEKLFVWGLAVKMIEYGEGMIKILELFGGIGSPRCALRNIGIPVKAIDYVEIDKKAVKSYNAMFESELPYTTQSVVGWNLKPDILIHGSPCQDFSIAGHQGKATAAGGRINRGKGADKGSGTRSSLMWETINIIRQMGEWKPRFVIWENVKNVTSKHMIHNFNRYLSEMQRLGYINSFQTLDAREFGLPQARERVFTISVLGGDPFNFDDLIKTPMRNIAEFLENDVPEVYTVTQPSVYNAIGQKGIRRATVIKDYAYTITARQDRTPAQVIDLGGGKYRYLTERECWRLQGYSDADFEAAAAVQEKNGRYAMALYKQAGNSIPVTIFESIFRKIILGQTNESGGD